ncbi:hypothetical protein [Mycobacteroides abscessus]|uniref:hypothetical protein n=1 Tax=Mycobacteroides abscessus TaxID=36809 RepID=UPI0012FFFC13|nr:hypothetical protein [Mycobacteroides abscessus]
MEFNSEDVDHARLMELREQFSDDRGASAASDRPPAHAAPDSQEEAGASMPSSSDFSLPHTPAVGGLSIPAPSLAAKYGLPSPNEQEVTGHAEPADGAEANPSVASTSVDATEFSEASTEGDDEPDYLSATNIYSSQEAADSQVGEQAQAHRPTVSGFTPIAAPVAADQTAVPAQPAPASIGPQDPPAAAWEQHRREQTASTSSYGDVVPPAPAYPQQHGSWQPQSSGGYGSPELPQPAAPQAAPQQPTYSYPPQQQPGYPPQAAPQQPGQPYPEQSGYPPQAPAPQQPTYPQSGWRAAAGRGQSDNHGQQSVPPAPTRDEDTASTTLPPQMGESYRLQNMPPSYQDPRSPGAAGNVAPKGGKQQRPTMGWRAVVAKATGASITKSGYEIEYDMDVTRVNVPLGNCKKIGFASFKGGVGKTVSAMCISSVLADLISKGQVTLIDTVARGTAASRIGGEQTSNIKAFAAAARAGQLGKDSQVDQHMLNNKYRLSVLGADQSYLNGPLTPDEYYAVLDRLEMSNIVIGVDMDPSTSSLGYREITESLDALVLVTDIASDALAQLYHHFGWLRAQGFDELTRRTVVLFNHRSKGNKDYIDLRKQVLHFEQVEHCEGRVFEIPWDRHLSEAGPIDLDLLDKGTRRQYVKAAAQAMQVLPRT